MSASGAEFTASYEGVAVYRISIRTLGAGHTFVCVGPSVAVIILQFVTPLTRECEFQKRCPRAQTIVLELQMLRIHGDCVNPSVIQLKLEHRAGRFSKVRTAV